MDLELLKLLCETPGAPGREERIRAVVLERLEALCDEVRVDNLGNVIGHRSARGPAADRPPLRLMLTSHIDEISFIVSHIDDRGFLRFHCLGGFDARTLTAQRVVVHGEKDLPGVMGTKPIHLLSEAEKKAPPRLEDYFIDLGLPADEVRKLVHPGDVVTRQREVIEIGECLNGKSFDDRVGVYVMLKALEKVGAHAVDLWLVASTQEEVGLRGAEVAARDIDPDVGINLDVTLANDVPDTKEHEFVCRLGAGTAIKVMDSSVICSHQVVTFLRELARDRGIPHQMEILPRGGSDTGAVQRAGRGAAVGCLSIPTRYVHSVIEMCHRRDIEASVDLLTAFIEEAHRGTFRP